MLKRCWSNSFYEFLNSIQNTAYIYCIRIAWIECELAHSHAKVEIQYLHIHNSDYIIVFIFILRIVKQVFLFVLWVHS